MKANGMSALIDRVLRIFFLASLTFTLSRTFIDSLFPLYLQDLGAQAAEISLIVTVAGLIATVCMSVSPLLAQRYGAKTLLVVSSGLGVIPPLALSLSDQWLVAAPWTILHHVVFALHLPARMLFIADQSRQGAVGRVFGYMNLVWPLAGIIGPLVGGVVADTWGWPPVFYLQILLAILSVVPLLQLPDTPRLPQPVQGGDASYRDLFQGQPLQTSVVGFTLCQFLSHASIGLADLVIPLYLTSHFGFTTTTVGVFFSVGGGISTLIAQIPSGYLTDQMGGRALMLRALTVVPIAFFLYPFITDGVILLLVYMIISGFRSATWPASMAYIITLVPRQLRGVAIGLNQIANRLGFTFGPFLGGLCWQYANPTATFLVASGLSTIAVVALVTASESAS
jgi:DHA1 family multidrug resistance protein-like MFS transporter